MTKNLTAKESYITDTGSSQMFGSLEEEGFMLCVTGGFSKFHAWCVIFKE